MSIAVSALIIPSRIVKVLTVVMCAGAIAIGATIGAGVSNDLMLGVRLTLAAVCILSALSVIKNVWANGESHRLDISATGIISICVADSAKTDITSNSQQRPHICTLLPSSTLWSSMMILNLQGHDGRKSTLVVFPDTLSNESFRSLSVACRWLAARSTNKADEKA
ncbi:MAG: protein YgfX [Pseudomonadota bacterium]